MYKLSLPHNVLVMDGWIKPYIESVNRKYITRIAAILGGDPSFYRG
jgi:hypothetical protein